MVCRWEHALLVGCGGLEHVLAKEESQLCPPIDSNDDDGGGKGGVTAFSPRWI
jgi:hypothetical protein